jgi:hypothetical protein
MFFAVSKEGTRSAVRHASATLPASTRNRSAWLGSNHVQLVPEGRPESPSEVDELLRALGLHHRVRAHLDNLSAIARTVHTTPMVAALGDLDRCR